MGVLRPRERVSGLFAASRHPRRIRALRPGESLSERRNRVDGIANFWASLLRPGTLNVDVGGLYKLLLHGRTTEGSNPFPDSRYWRTDELH